MAPISGPSNSFDQAHIEELNYCALSPRRAKRGDNLIPHYVVILHSLLVGRAGGAFRPLSNPLAATLMKGELGPAGLLIRDC